MCWSLKIFTVSNAAFVVNLDLDVKWYRSFFFEQTFVNLMLALYLLHYVQYRGPAEWGHGGIGVIFSSLDFGK